MALDPIVSQAVGAGDDGASRDPRTIGGLVFRNLLRGDGYFTIDTSLSKAWSTGLADHRQYRQTETIDRRKSHTTADRSRCIHAPRCPKRDIPYPAR